MLLSGVCATLWLILIVSASLRADPASNEAGRFCYEYSRKDTIA
jgi:hypothetical protein